jgi:arylsulfatase A
VGSRYWNPTLSERGATIPVSEKEFGPNLVNAYAKQFVRSPKPEPFFLLYSMVLPHWPFVPTPDSGPGGQRERTDAYQQRLGGEEYFPDMVAYLDRLVGQLVAQLRTMGIEKETLILFTSDNGCARNIISEKGDELIPGGYGTLTDPGTRVPMIAWWPGGIRAGGVCDDLIDFSDILPTLAEIGGHAVPESSIVDGQSFAAQLKGLPAQSRDMVLCDSFSEPIAEPEDVAEKRAYLKKVAHQVRVKMAGRFVRSKRYKLYADERFYDMQNDPEEERELQRLSAEAGAAKEFLEEGLATLPPWSPFLVGPHPAEPHPAELHPVEE